MRLPAFRLPFFVARIERSEIRGQRFKLLGRPRISRSLSSGRPLRAGPVGSIRATGYGVSQSSGVIAPREGLCCAGRPPLPLIPAQAGIQPGSPPPRGRAENGTAVREAASTAHSRASGNPAWVPAAAGTSGKWSRCTGARLYRSFPRKRESSLGPRLRGTSGKWSRCTGGRLYRSFPRKRESSLGPRLRGDERKMQPSLATSPAFAGKDEDEPRERFTDPARSLG